MKLLQRFGKKQKKEKPDFVNGWISVNKEMPAENQWVFFYHGSRYPRLAKYVGKNRWLCEYGTETWYTEDDQIEYWIPMPQIPKEIR